MYTVHNKTNRQINVNLDGTDDPKTTIVVPPNKLKKVELTSGQYQYVKKNYRKSVIVKKLNG